MFSLKTAVLCATGERVLRKTFSEVNNIIQHLFAFPSDHSISGTPVQKKAGLIKCDIELFGKPVGIQGIVLRQDRSRFKPKLQKLMPGNLIFLCKEINNKASKRMLVVYQPGSVINLYIQLNRSSNSVNSIIPEFSTIFHEDY